MASIARQASEDSASGSEPEDNSDYSDSENEDDEDDEEEWEYVSGDEEEQEEIQIKTAAPFTLYKDTTSLTNLRNKMITDVTNMLACSRDIALHYLESHKFSTNGNDILKFINEQSNLKNNETKEQVIINGCAVCGCGAKKEEQDDKEDQEDSTTNTVVIPKRVKRKGRKKGPQAVTKELKSLIKSKAIKSDDAPWSLTFEPTHMLDSMVFTQRPQPNTLWYCENHPGYKFSINCSNDYPTKAPEVICLDSHITFHPNVDTKTGHVCLNRLLADWSPLTQLYDIMLRIDSLFHEEQAGWGSDLNTDGNSPSNLYHKDKQQFKKKVQRLVSGSSGSIGSGVNGETKGNDTSFTSSSNTHTVQEKEEDGDDEETELITLHEQCGHTLCVKCWDDYITEQIRQYGVAALQSICPVTDCHLCLPDSLLLRFGGELYTKHAISTHFVNQCVSSSVLVRCRNVKCTTLSSSSNSEQIINCLCGEQYCFGCRHPPHTPATCFDMK